MSKGLRFYRDYTRTQVYGTGKSCTLVQEQHVSETVEKIVTLVSFKIIELQGFFSLCGQGVCHFPGSD